VKISKKTLRITAVLAAIILLITACNLPMQAATPQAAPAQTTATSTANQPIPSPEPTQDSGLPSALYLLSKDQGGLHQVWRISQDRTVIEKLTAEPNTVDNFAVNPSSGKIAYITNNQIYLINADKSGRTLIVDGSGHDENNDSYYFREKINGLAWSKDGSQLAYGQNGLNIYSAASGTSQNIILNELEEGQGGMIFPRAIYTPISWSPDGSLLLVDIGFIEAGTLGIYNPETGNIVRLGEGIVCCHPIWSPDSRSVVVGSPYFGMIASGLWRYNVTTGAETELIPTTSDDNTLNYAGWPVVLSDGQLQFFYGNTADFPSSDVPLTMVRTAPDGQTGLTALRNEEWVNYEVIWSPGGNLAITIQPTPGEAPGWPRLGPVVLIPTDGSPAIPLGINGYLLRWGP